MNVLIATTPISKNQYVKLLAEYYEKCGVKIIWGAENFLFSNFQPDFIHIQWPEAIYRWTTNLAPSKKSIATIRNRLVWYKNQQIPIVYTLHNLLPHENIGSFDKDIFEIIWEYSDIIVHHGLASIKLAKKQFKQFDHQSHLVCPHGPYPYFKANSQQSKTKFGLPLDKYVYLNFGIQRKTKGCGFARSVFNKWGESNAFLFTFGKKYHAKNTKNDFEKGVQYLTTIFNSRFEQAISFFRSNEKTVDKAVPQNELPEVVESSDVFFLGHQTGLNSGNLALAASYGKPVVYPDIGNFTEQLKDWPWKEAYKAGNTESAIDALNRMKAKIADKNPGHIKYENSAWLKTNSWHKHVGLILSEIKKRKS